MNHLFSPWRFLKIATCSNDSLNCNPGINTTMNPTTIFMSHIRKRNLFAKKWKGVWLNIRISERYQIVKEKSLGNFSWSEQSYSEIKLNLLLTGKQHQPPLEIRTRWMLCIFRPALQSWSCIHLQTIAWSEEKKKTCTFSLCFYNRKISTSLIFLKFHKSHTHESQQFFLRTWFKITYIIRGLDWLILARYK